MTPTFGSLFAGQGGFDLGLERSGLTCSWQVEIDNQCNAVLAHHWPNVKRLEDIRDAGKHSLSTVDLVCGGFPCQDVSVAGRREGLAGERSGLWFEFHRILSELKPRWVIVENVPGLLSSNGGRDFATILRGLVELGYGVCWRILDAQYFGVAQRRRRVFIVGSLGNGRAAQVLFESESSAWDSAPSRETGKGIAATVGTLATNTGPKGHDSGNLMSNQAVDAGYIVPALQRTVGALQARDFKGIGNQYVDEGKLCLTPLDHESKRIHDSGGPSPTLAGSDGQGGQRMPYVIQLANSNSWGDLVQESETARTIDVHPSGPRQAIAIQLTGDRDNPSVSVYDDVHPTISANPMSDRRSAIAFQQNTRDEVRMIGGDGSHAGALTAQPGMKQQTYVAEIHGGSKRKDRPKGCFYVRNDMDTTKPLDTSGLQPAANQGGIAIVSPTIGADISRQAGGHPGIEEYTNAVMNAGFGVRRLTPRECERLQGFPDDFTAIDGMSDSARYRMLGNAVAVPVAEWIGKMILEADKA